MSAQDFWFVGGEVVRWLAAASTGVFAGAMLTEAGVLVPYWRSLEAGAFHHWYRGNASRLVAFFGPLTWLAGVSALASALQSWLADHPGQVWAAWSAILVLIVVAMFPLYFKAANAGFVAGASGADGTRRALSRWAAWHYVRTV